ncbi:MAG TPA: MBL fold metallo-hydrolase [Xanthobacteraceae bacterium]|nr:MBL fold metallo-hydrolase [Xanthobacteraceae bacterium]
MSLARSVVVAGIAALVCALASAAMTFAAMTFAAMTSAAMAQTLPAPVAPPDRAETQESCPGLIAAERPRITPAAFKVAALGEDQVRLTFIGHATFLIESPQQVRIATDYNDYVKLPVTPDIATMNHAHETHYTDHPDPAIKYVLRGWGESPDKPAIWDLKYRDVRVRNVPTNIRTWSGGTERYGNSIFVFEIANLCIAHLGHLHHTLTQAQLDAIGRVDVVMAPVDGNYTLDLDGMMQVLTALKAPLIIPMHFFGWYTLEGFLERAQRQWRIERAELPSVVVSKATLPKSPKVLVLPGF